jgi:hypothetical protein
VSNTYNATNALNTSAAITAQAADICTVEGLATGTRVPGVATTLALPNNTCDLATANSACGTSGDFECDLTKTAGDVCKCEAVVAGIIPAGSDTCVKYSPCVRTPCKICSDCLADMTAFVALQQYTLAKAELAAAFEPYCLSKSYTTASCSAAVTKILDAATPLPFGKRAGSLCAVMSMCNAATIPIDCVLKPTANVTGTGSAALDLCAVEGVTDGSDVQGTTRNLALPAGRCDTDAGCNNDGSNIYMCNLALTAQLCTCTKGADNCRAVGTCQLRPCPACEQCLTDFAGVTAATFAATCDSTNRPSIACATAASGIANSFNGNAGSRAGAVCQLLGECSPARMSGCK